MSLQLWLVTLGVELKRNPRLVAWLIKVKCEVAKDVGIAELAAPLGVLAFRKSTEDFFSFFSFPFPSLPHLPPSVLSSFLLLFLLRTIKKLVAKGICDL